MRRRLIAPILALSFIAFGLLQVFAITEQTNDDLPAPRIINDEGGPVTITGQVTYTSPLFTLGVSEPLVMLEDQTGYIQRDDDYAFPLTSQVLGQITSDFRTSPFTYNIALPARPQAPLNDVDNDGDSDAGIMVYAVAYWSNTFGDAYLEPRDQTGAGWSTAYASVETSSAAATSGEYIGGKLLIYAPDARQGFPSGFGDDGLLFTADDPIVRAPSGYSVVNLDADPFTFNRARQATLDLIEGEAAAPDDFSRLDIVPAFDAMVDKLRREYAFTDYKNIDWDALSAEYRPRILSAQADADALAYYRTLRDFLWSIPDGHISSNLLSLLFSDYVTATDGGIGLALGQLDDGRIIATHVIADTPAAQAGIQRGAHILTIQQLPTADYVARRVPWSSPFSTDHVRRLQQLRYATRFRVDETVTLSYRNPGADVAQTVTLTTINELASFDITSFNRDASDYDLPVQVRDLPGDLAYVQILSFADDDRLTIQLWERMLRTMRQEAAAGLVIDMRNNDGGSGFLADQMAAYFFDEPHLLGNRALYDEASDSFQIDPDAADRFILPPADLRYAGPVAVLVGPNCSSACEFFAYNMTIEDRATIVGHYPTGGLGGSIGIFDMPGGVRIQYTVGRSLDADGNIHIEGIGVVPDVRVPVTEAALLSDDDAVLQAAIAQLQNP